MRIRHLILVFSLVCILWVLFVPATYAFTLDDNIFVNWLDRMTNRGRFSSAVLAAFFAFEVILIPVGLTCLFRFAWDRKLGCCFGPVAGLVVGLWTTTLLITLPYIGVYPNILSAHVGSLLSRGSNQGPAYYLGAFATNVVIWPLVGWLIFRRKRVPT